MLDRQWVFSKTLRFMPLSPGKLLWRQLVQTLDETCTVVTAGYTFTVQKRSEWHVDMSPGRTRHHTIPRQSQNNMKSASHFCSIWNETKNGVNWRGASGSIIVKKKCFYHCVYLVLTGLSPLTGVSEHLYTAPRLSPLPNVNKHLTSFLDNSLYIL